MILGDSIAVGVGQARPGCTTVAKSGITSGTYMQTLFPGAPRSAKAVVISLGVNDDPSMATLETLRTLRRAVQAPRVTWLLPGIKDDVRGFILTVARENRDQVVDTRSQVGPDHLHPGTAGYRILASWTELPGTAPPIGSVPAPVSALASAARRGPSFPLQDAWAHPITVTGRGLPIVHTPGMPLRLQPMLGLGSVYGIWPVAGGSPFGAVPPQTYAYRAFPNTVR